MCFGLYYIYTASTTSSRLWKKINNFLGVVLLAGSILLATESYQETFYQHIHPQTSFAWHTDYQIARQQARKEGKKLFIDFWSQWCSICNAIDQTVLQDPQILSTLQKQFIPLKIDGTSAQEEPYATVGKKFHITGFPTFLIVDPETETVIKTWSSEIYTMPRQEFMQKLSKFI